MKKNTGFAILYTILIITIAVTMSANVLSLVTKERALSKVARDSVEARAATDVGMECMLYKDKMPTQFDPNINSSVFTMNCGRDTAGNTISYNVTLQSCIPGPPPLGCTTSYLYEVSTTSSSVIGTCFKAYLQRDLSVTPAKTKVDIFGYNICDISDPKRVERGIIAEY